MKLDRNLPNQFATAGRRIDRLMTHFTQFKSALSWFKEPKCEIGGVQVHEGDDPWCFAVSFGSVSVSLHVLPTLNDQGVLMGKVVCTRVQPKLSVEDPVLATFDFNGQGITSFDNLEHGDPVEMEQHAPEIVLHMLALAVRHVVG